MMKVLAKAVARSADDKNNNVDPNSTAEPKLVDPDDRSILRAEFLRLNEYRKLNIGIDTTVSFRSLVVIKVRRSDTNIVNILCFVIMYTGDI